MATNFEPEVQRFFLDTTAYPSGTHQYAQYNQPKIEDLADALVALSSAWTDPWVRVYSNLYHSQELCYTVLERTISGNQSQIVLAYSEDSWASYIHPDNRYQSNSSTRRGWIGYKPHTRSPDIDWSGSNPVLTGFIGGGFKWAHFHSYNHYFCNQNYWFTWLADERSDNIVLLGEVAASHDVRSVVVLGDSVLTYPFNVGINRWHGVDPPISHPNEDVAQELFYVRYYESMTPGVDQPNSVQWYDTDGAWQGYYSAGCSIREEFLRPNAASAPPYPREPVAVMAPRYQRVWTDPSRSYMPVRGNSLKGFIEPDIMSAISPDPLAVYELVNDGEMIHVRDGMCIGWNPSFGPMP